MVELLTYNPMENYHIKKLRKDLRKLPKVVGTTARGVKSFLKKLIDIGSQLDHLFALGDVENPSYSIQEDLIETYNKWSLDAGYTLLVSEFGVKNDLRIKYPALTENDGVHSILLPLMQLGKFNGDLSLGQKIRFGESYRGENFIRPSAEGIKQFKNAHIYLKKKITALSEIFKNEASKPFRRQIKNHYLEKFDEKNSVLHLAGKAIKISKNVQSDPHDLLRTLSLNQNKVWSTDEIIDDWKYLPGEKPVKNKVYQAGKAVNRIVAQETKIKDFLKVSTKEVAINKKYLKPQKSL